MAELAQAGLSGAPGHVTMVHHWNKTSGTGYSEYAVTGTTKTVAQTALSFSATSGRKYTINSNCSGWPYAATSNNSIIGVTFLYYGTTARAQGATSLDTQLSLVRSGRITQTSTTGQNGYYPIHLQGQFTAGSTATHYVYLAIQGNSAEITMRMLATTQGDWDVTVVESLP